MSSKPLEDAIRALPASWFRPNRFVYWCDLVVSAGAGWLTVAAAAESDGWWRAALFMVAGFALYRAVLFIHEITHLARRDVPGFTAAWNVLVGIPLLLPSFLYETVHNDHHRQRFYGTPADPEYLPFGRRSPALIAGYVLASALLPIAAWVRFAILAPVSWLVPPLRRMVEEHGSALVINSRYVRHAKLDTAARIEEAAACGFAWGALFAWDARLFPTVVLVFWVVFAAAASALNALRTLAAHRYDRDDGELTMIEQLLDSCTIATTAAGVHVMTVCRMLFAPVGLRYHALHHWIPSLPYHNLGRAHRRLIATLTADAPYRAATYPAFTPVVVDLVKRARAQAR